MSSPKAICQSNFFVMWTVNLLGPNLTLDVHYESEDVINHNL